ncbi:hypothetical protein BC351_31940 [Paenibacillus ferrarius]|uniref:Sulfotransferase domain-containing protein n=1 Tax=Paenibacillus ferrarius TaxID=1469647 RepID=A0A1V4HEZ8_9BACL|nr:hypothetical protein [Paenibacillus ferrarius]OPH53092.1 hypothetical protein BC351_31940 [Paenibacillus ferrarius]
MGKAICVLGMHRSGTSMLMKTLNNLGVYLGKDEDMLAIADDNPEGFWEHRGIVEIHENILSELNRRWDSLTPLPKNWLNNPRVQQYKLDLIELIKREFKNVSVWGFKDPRTCILIPLWNEIYEVLEMEVSYIIILRNPLDIANSLNKRNDINKQYGIALWYYYMINIMEYTRGCNKLVLHYDSILEETINSARIIASYTGLEINSEIEMKIRESIKPELRHSKSTFNELSLYTEERAALLYKNSKDIFESEYTEIHSIENYNFYTRLVQLEELDKQYLTNVQIINKLNYSLAEASQVARNEIDRKNIEIGQKNIEIKEKNGKIELMNSEIELKNSEIEHKNFEIEKIRKVIELNKHETEQIIDAMQNMQNIVDRAEAQSILLAHTKLFKCVHLIYRLKHQLIKGNIKAKREFFSWLFKRFNKQEYIKDRQYNPIYQITDILESNKIIELND